MSEQLKIVVIGAGAAGFFGAIATKESFPKSEVILLEKAKQVLSKVRISGGGRCNVTHACFDVSTLVKNYPRGEKVLKSAFMRFQPKDTIEWFLKRGVDLKKEADGRMFPVTNSSETIIHTLMKSAKEVNVILKTECGVQEISKKNDHFLLKLSNGQELCCDRILVTTGSSHRFFDSLRGLGHTIEPLLPSLFTFNIKDSPLKELSGISVPNVHLKIAKTNLEQKGPLLITHFGFSGPSILKLSAWGASLLHEMGYHFTLQINWVTDFSHESLKEHLLKFKSEHSLKKISTLSPLPLPNNLWRSLIDPILKKDDLKWSEISLKELNQIVEKLKNDTYQIDGKTTFKEEFVTCGGVSLNEVDFKTMESRLCKGLFFAGEVLNIDGITGGFNFQNAWTTSWIAGHSIGYL